MRGAGRPDGEAAIHEELKGFWLLSRAYHRGKPEMAFLISAWEDEPGVLGRAARQFRARHRKDGRAS